MPPSADRPPAVTASEKDQIANIEKDLARLIRYDDESITAEKWVRQRYDCGCYSTYGLARRAAVRTAWHEAGHAVAALAVGATFSSVSIHHGHRSEGRVHGVRAREQAFVVDTAGQIAERLMTWTLPATDSELRTLLLSWKDDGGDSRRFRGSIAPRFAGDEAGAWRYCEAVLTPLRPEIRRLARALLTHPRHLPYPVAAAIADQDRP